MRKKVFCQSETVSFSGVVVVHEQTSAEVASCNLASSSTMRWYKNSWGLYGAPKSTWQSECAETRCVEWKSHV